MREITGREVKDTAVGTIALESVDKVTGRAMLVSVKGGHGAIYQMWFPKSNCRLNKKRLTVSAPLWLLRRLSTEKGIVFLAGVKGGCVVVS